MRMIAGPNGSGKSVIKRKLNPAWLGVDINPDDIEAAIRDSGFLDLSDYAVSASPETFIDLCGTSELLKQSGLSGGIARLTTVGSRVMFHDVGVNSYFASVASDFIRNELIKAQVSFTFETVMSHAGKVEFMETARHAGFRTYLYYVATESAEINVQRVQARVAQGGHDVPEQKITSRYQKSLSNLYNALRLCDRAFIWDNSGTELLLLAELDGDELKLESDRVPRWFDVAVLSRLK